MCLSFTWTSFSDPCVILFTGAAGDYIEGNDGTGIILGDFGLYEAEVQFLPNQYFESLTQFAEYAGPDTIKGGNGKCTCFG